MATIEKDITPLTIKEFLSKDKYVIPIYQRNYDWGEKEALQLIEDVADYAQNNTSQHYYIGSAIVFARNANGNKYYETIDGQQRLTTLTILANLLKNGKCAEWYEKANISYDHRKEADDALVLLKDEQYEKQLQTHNIIEVYKIFKKHLERILLTRQLTPKQFAEYLFDKVVILRILVPQDTQLNHYFEIMNTRGEQLEKHEVLKAILLSKLDSSEHRLFHLIWEACSDMNSYVQMNFTVAIRSMIFGENWDTLPRRNFDELCDDLFDIEEHEINIDGYDECSPHSLNDLFQDARNNIRYELPNNDSTSEGRKDRFGSIINFPNFLLHALKICYHKSKYYDKNVDMNIRLDDKNLIQIFQRVLTSIENESDRRSFVKFFIVELLFLRMLYDKYAIKREYLNGSEVWSLKTLRKYDNNRANYVNSFSEDRDYEGESNIGKEIRMLEAMFHVSAPTQIYKHWLNAVLYYVYQQENINPTNLAHELYDLACCYMLDVYIGAEKTDFETIIYKNLFKPTCRTIDWSQLDDGCKVPNFIFNFYDFITWKQDQITYAKFEFTYRTSVEHFYPQHPMSGYKDLKDNGLNDFGNLCLISNHMNSMFSNNMPKAKLENFGKMDEIRNGLSLKLLEMMAVIEKEGEWSENQIANFEESARHKILDAIQKGLPDLTIKCL